IQMTAREPLEINSEHHVTVEDKKMIGEQIQRSQHRARGSHRLLLDKHSNAETEPRAVADKVDDLFRKMTRDHCHFVDAVGSGQFQLMLKKGFAANADQRLRY